MAGKLMRYPADIIDASTDYFKIEILKNIKSVDLKIFMKYGNTMNVKLSLLFNK